MGKGQEEKVKAFLMLPHSDLQELLLREKKKFIAEIKASKGLLEINKSKKGKQLSPL